MESTEQIEQDEVLESEEVEAVLVRRKYNADLITGDEIRDRLPSDLIAKVDKIQKCLNRFKSLHQYANETFIKEVKSLNLNRYTIEVAESIAKTEFAFTKDPGNPHGSFKTFETDLRIIVDICEIMHRRYEDFQKQLVIALTKQFKALSKIEDAEVKTNQRRAMLFFMTELFIIGIILEYKRIFQSLQEIFAECKT